MTTAATSLLGLALPVTGELSGTWGDTVNNSITSLLDSAIAGTTTLSTDADVTLTTTTLSANQAREAIILWTAAGTVTRTITAPAQSKTYVVINKSSTQSIKLVGVGPTTGVTLVAGELAVVAWNGTDFVKTANASGAASFTDLTVSGSETLSGGTANGVAYLNGSKVVTTGSALTFDGTILGVGSGATAGYGVFQVRGGFAYVNEDGANTKQLYLRSNYGGNGPAIQVGGTDPLQFILNSAEQMRLTSTGLGIGTSSPSVKLDILGATPFIRLQENTTGYLGFRGQNSSGNFYFGIDSSTGGFYGSAYARVIYADGAYPMVFYTNATEKMRLDSSGNLALGTTSALSSSAGRTDLTINGASTGAIISFGNGGTRKSYVYQDGTDFSIFNEVSTGVLRFGTNGSERARIDSSGNLLVGRTSQISSGRLCVQKTSGANNSIEAIQGDAGGYNFYSSAANNSGSYYHASFTEGGTQRGSIVSNGTATLYNTTSDQRLKENIVDAPEFGGVIDSMQVRSYDWKSDGSHQRYGFIAQELVTVAPEAVHQPADPEEMMAVDYSKLVPMLVKEIQDLRKRLAAAGIA